MSIASPSRQVVVDVPRLRQLKRTAEAEVATSQARTAWLDWITAIREDGPLLMDEVERLQRLLFEKNRQIADLLYRIEAREEQPDGGAFG